MAPDRRPYASLRHTGFRRYALGMFVSLVGSQMQNTAIDWHVWVLTGSPLALGAVGLVRFVPIVFFSLAGGLVADRYDRRRVLLAAQGAMLASAAALAFLTLTGRVNVGAIYGLTAVTAPGAGAAAASAVLALRSLPRRQGRLLLGAVAVYGAATAVFGLSRSFALTLGALMLVGATDTVSTVVRQTVRSLATPDALRGRMTSVNQIFVQGGPQLGEMEAGLVASLFASAAIGVTVAVVSGGVATALVAAAVAWKAPSLVRYDVENAVPEARAADPEGP